MKLETIKRNNKKRIIIGSMIVLSVVGCITLTTTRAKYRNVQSIKLASGTVKISSYDFKIVAMYQQKEDADCTEDSCYDTLTGRIPSTGYIINEDKSYCSIDGRNKDEKAVLKTNSAGEHVISNLIKNEKCFIWFDNKPPASKTILANIKKITGAYKGDLTPTFTSAATGAEDADNNGIFETDDPMYKTADNPNPKTYYWRGAATTNHVIFDDKCWRIVRINGDGSIRLIYNGAAQSENTCHGNGSWAENVVLKETAYNSSRNNSSYVGWTYSAGNQRPSTAKPQNSGTAVLLKTSLETWYRDNITNKSKIVKGYFCNDRDIGSGSYNGAVASFYYAGYTRLTAEAKTPQLSCSDGDVYNLDVGMIIADEVMLAGAPWATANQSYYLYNGQYYWTMTPTQFYYYSSSNQYAQVFVVWANGGLNNASVSDTMHSVRPVINLRSDVTFNSDSDGTQNNPYIVQ